MNTPGNNKLGSGRKWNTEIGPFLTLGLQLAITAVAFFFLGRWLDAELGTAPWLMFGGILVGVVGGLLKFFRTVIAIGKKEEEQAGLK